MSSKSSDEVSSRKNPDKNPKGSDARKSMRTQREITLFIVITLLILGVDLISKKLSFQYVADEPVQLDPEIHSDPTVQAVPYHDTVIVIPKVLGLRLTLNRGAVFGLGQGKRWVFVLVSVLAIGAISWAFWSSPPAPQGGLYRLLLALILAGALGNLYDRVVFAGVRDMLFLFPDVHLPFGWTWPNKETLVYPWIFNVADVSLVIGVFAMMLQSFVAAKEEAKAKKDDPDALQEIKL